MPLPTWRDVAAPDFSGSMKGMELFSNLLNQGLNTASSGLKVFDQGKSDQVNKAIAMQLAALNDPATAAAQAREIIAAADPNRISMENVNRGNTVTADLQNRAVAGLNFKKTTDDFARTERVKAAINGAQPEMAAFGQAVQSTDRTKIDAAHAALNTKLTELGMTAEDMFNFDPKLLDRQKSGFDMAVGYKNDQRGDTRWGWNVRDDGQEQKTYQETEQAKELVGELTLGGYQTKDDIYRVIKEKVDSGKLSGRVAGMVASSMGLSALPDADPNDGIDWTGGTGGGGSYAPTGGAGGTAAQHIEMANEFQNLGFDQAFSAAMVGNSIVEGGYAGGQGDGGSAAGHFQWREDRRENFKKIIGKDPSKATPAESAKFVAWEFKNPKSSGAFVPKNGMSPEQQVQAILAEKDPGKKAALVDIYYERSSGAHRGKRVAAANSVATMLAGAIKRTNENTQTTAGDMEDNYRNSVPSMFTELAASRDKPMKVAANLLVKYPGLDESRINSRIASLMDHVAKNGGNRKVLNAAIAGQIIEDNLRVGTGLTDWFTGDPVGGGKYLDMEAAKDTAMAYTNGKMDSAIGRNAGRAKSVADRTAAEARVAALRQRITTKQNIARRRGGVADTRNEERDLAIAESLANQAADLPGMFGAAPDDPNGGPMANMANMINSFVSGRK